jgi:hypothetical protein
VEVCGLLVAFEACRHGGGNSVHSHPSQKARRMGHPEIWGWSDVGVRAVYFPTLRKKREGWGTLTFWVGWG